jgi:SAM-dependent methyltransferase
VLHERDLVCPATGQPLDRQGDELRSADGARRYPVVAGVPVLISSERSLFDLDDFRAPPAASQSRGGVLRRLARLLPSDSLNVATDRYVSALRTELLAGEPATPPRVLVIGGGIAGAGLGALLKDRGLDVVETDVWFGPRVELVCDGHDLPFRDGAFDAVVCQAVLEHVLDPVRVVAEMHRVLAPHGLAYSEIPFMQQVHEGAHDFTRYTHLGHRRLFRHFDELASGAVCGPGMALAWSLRYFAVTLAGDSVWRRRAAAAFMPLLTWWLPRLDRLLIDRPGALDAASSIAFLGRRRETPVPDEQIVAAYRGVNALPARRA